jgi:hypothetical protein
VTKYALIRQFGFALRQLDTWLEKAGENATARKFDVEVLVQSRLAPDQYPLARQVQSACDAAKFAAAGLTGKAAPANPDVEATVAELRTRIATTLGFLETVSEADFAGADERQIKPAWARGKFFTADDYARQVAMPNFYFHITTAYSILRHNGVPLGKNDFLGPINLQG